LNHIGLCGELPLALPEPAVGGTPVVDATRVLALSAVCTHVRCILGYEPARRTLICPCHDGRFDLSGNVLSGPPPRPLPGYPASVRAGEIFVQV